MVQILTCLAKYQSIHIAESYQMWNLEEKITRQWLSHCTVYKLCISMASLEWEICKKLFSAKSELVKYQCTYIGK